MISYDHKENKTLPLWGFESLGWPAETGTPPEPTFTDRVKVLEIILGCGTDAFTATDLKGAVFLRLGDPTEIFCY